MKVIIGTYRADRVMIDRCYDSLVTHLSDTERWRPVFVDDSGSKPFRMWLRQYGDVVPVADDNAGYAKAMDKVCEVMREQADDYVMFWEEDFVATERIELDKLRDELENDPTLAQVVLVRQPWFPNEIERGDVIAAMAERFDEPIVVEQGAHEKLWVHQMQFSTNPAVWAPMAYRWPWPQCRGSEEAKTHYLVEDDKASFAFFGNRVRVHHDGERMGVGY